MSTLVTINLRSLVSYLGKPRSLTNTKHYKKKVPRVPKSTKKHQKAPKSTKKYQKVPVVGQ